MYQKKFDNDNLVNDNIQELLCQFNINIKNDNGLSELQNKAFDLFKNKENIMLIGSGGVGKSFLLKTFKEYTKLNSTKNFYMCSSTGVSSYNIGGMTIHSFMNIGTGDKDVEFYIKRMKKTNRTIIENTDILVIDELSMLSASLFEKINAILQIIRKNNTFFGGIQVVFSMDPLQLLPVFNKNIIIYGNEPEDTRLIIESLQFTKEFNKIKNNIIVLKENFRQKGKTLFIDMLLRIREGIHTQSDIKLLDDKCKKFKIEIKKEISQPIHIVSTNKKAKLINDFNVNKLIGSDVIFTSSFETIGNDSVICNVLKKELESQFKQKCIIEIILKKECRVMLIKNLDVSIGLVNGSIGTVTDFTSNGFPIVLFDNSIVHTVTKCNFELEINNNKAIIKQLPLILAYSINIHRVQSLSLDTAILDLENCFCEGMIYTALSRLKSFDGLYLKSFNHKKITVNQKMINYLKQFN